MKGFRFARLALLMLLALGMVGCDHATKIAAKASLEGAAAVPVVDLRYTENDDVAFSALHRIGVPRSRAALIGLGVLALAGIALAAARRRRTAEDADQGRRAEQVGVALVVGGALGNLVDRVVRGYVVDFIHIRGWPVFNVADIAVVVGVGLIVGARLWARHRGRHPASP